MEFRDKVSKVTDNILQPGSAELAPMQVQMPTDHPRPALQSFRGAVHEFAFSQDLSASLRKFAEREHCRLSDVTLSFFAALLQRYSLQEDFIIGLSGEPHGVFHWKNRGDANVRELLEFTQGLAGDTPANGAHFNALFSFVPDASANWNQSLDTSNTQCDFALQLRDGAVGVEGRIGYAAELFEASTVERMVGHFETMIVAAVSDPEQKISKLPMLSARETQQLAEWNRTDVEYPRELCVHELVEAQVARTPNASAVEHGGQRLTYKELNERANQLARFLRKRGIGHESRVGICLRRSLELPVALLAVLKAGAACVPLDPAYPKERLSYMLSDSETPLVLTQPGLLSEVTDFEAQVVNLEPDWKAFADESRENVRSSVEPENLAYIIYTSGSTGKPRGVLLPHRGLVNHNVAAAALFGMTTTDRMAQFASISFDIAIEEIFPTWISGGSLIVREEDASLAVSDFLGWVEQNQVTALDLPTAYWHELVRELAESTVKLPKCLRLVIVGGEKASVRRASHLAQACWVEGSLGQHVWPDRDQRDCDILRAEGIGRDSSGSAHWPSHCEHQDLHPEQESAAAAGRRCGRLVRFWSRPGARISEPS